MAAVPQILQSVVEDQRWTPDLRFSICGGGNKDVCLMLINWCKIHRKYNHCLPHPNAPPHILWRQKAKGGKSWVFIIKTQISRGGKHSWMNARCQEQWWMDESGAWDRGKAVPEIKMTRWQVSPSSLQSHFSTDWLVDPIIMGHVHLIHQLSGEWMGWCAAPSVPSCLCIPSFIWKCSQKSDWSVSAFEVRARLTSFLERLHGTVTHRKHRHLPWETSKTSCCSGAEMLN